MAKREFTILETLKEHRPTVKYLVLLLTTGVFLGLLGPFGSFRAGIFLSLSYWITMSFTGYIILGPFVLLGTLFAAHKGYNPYPVFLASVVIGAIPMTFVVIAANAVFFATDIDDLSVFLDYYPFVVVVGLLIGGISILQRKWKEKKDILDNLPPENPGLEFLRRLPVDLGQDLICFVMEDHYLRVYTQKGEYLLLHRLKDALSELEGYNGLQVHRSWWVAAAAVEKARRYGRKVILTMSNGVEVPVSQPYQAAVRDRFSV